MNHNNTSHAARVQIPYNCGPYFLTLIIIHYNKHMSFIQYYNHQTILYSSNVRSNKEHRIQILSPLKIQITNDDKQCQIVHKQRNIHIIDCHTLPNMVNLLHAVRGIDTM